MHFDISCKWSIHSISDLIIGCHALMLFLYISVTISGHSLSIEMPVKCLIQKRVMLRTLICHLSQSSTNMTFYSQVKCFQHVLYCLHFSHRQNYKLSFWKVTIFTVPRPGESIFELLKEPSKRKIPPQKNTVDHILLFYLNLLLSGEYCSFLKDKLGLSAKLLLPLLGVK